MKNIKKILIAVLSFSLLFAISCDNEGKTGGGGTGGVGGVSGGGTGVGGNGGTGTGGSSGSSQSKSELVGRWKEDTKAPQPYIFYIYENGDIKFTLSEGILSYYDYTGKIADTFDYPYTVEIVANFRGKTSKGKFTFNSEKSCRAVFYKWYVDTFKGDYNSMKLEIDFIKQLY